jgi:hypothetical protein
VALVIVACQATVGVSGGTSGGIEGVGTVGKNTHDTEVQVAILLLSDAFN